MTEANFTVKQYQVMLEELKQDMASKLGSQPKALQKEVESALADFLRQEAALDAKRRTEEEAKKLSQMEQTR